MAKKSRSGAQPNPAIRLSNLGPRLARLLAEVADAPALSAQLDRLTEGLKPGSFLPIVVGVFAGAPANQREPLDAALVAWLQERDLLDQLRTLEARQSFHEPAQSLARAWLEAGGVTVAPLPAFDPTDLFIAAYELGEPSQDTPTLFWYEDARRRRVRSASFLVDFEPPWEGALKDLAYATYRNPGEATDAFFGLWRRQGIKPRALDAPTAAQRVWTALRQSQAQGLRLPADFIAVAREVLPFLLALPVGPDVVPLSLAELEAMASSGRTPESIRIEERRLGFQTRMPDGSILRVMGPPDDEF